MNVASALRRLVAVCVVVGVLTSGTGALGADTSAAPAGLVAVTVNGVTRTSGVPTFPRRTTPPVVDLSLSPSGRGYVTLDATGGIASYGDARRFARVALPRVGALPVAIALTATGQGAYVGFADGTIRALGDADGLGGPAGGRSRLVPPLVDVALSPDGRGLWALRADGSVAELGDVPALPDAPDSASPAVGIAATRTAAGAWVARLNGSVAPLGDARGGRGPRGATEPRVADIAALAPDAGWVVVDLRGDVEVRGGTPSPLPGTGSGFVAVDTLAASAAIGGAGAGAPVSTKVVAPAAIVRVTGDPAGEAVVELPCFVADGPTPLLEGDVLAAAIGPQTPDGLLRRVRALGSCAGGVVAVTTEPATLSDALPAGELSLSDDLSDLQVPDFTPTSEDGSITLLSAAPTGGFAPLSLPRERATRSVRPVAVTAAAVGTVADPGRFTYGCPSKPGDRVVELKAKPIFSFDPEVVFAGRWDTDEAHFRVGLGLQGELGVTLTATGTVACDAGFALIDGLSLGKKLVFVGPVPVVVEPKLSLKATLKGKAEGQVSATATSTGSISGAIAVDIAPGSDGSVTLDGSTQLTGSLDWGASAKAEATFTLTPSIGFLLYGTIAPTAELSAGLKGSFEPCSNPNLNLTAPLKLTTKLSPSEWLGEMLKPLSTIDLEASTDFDLPGSPILLHSEHLPTAVPCEATTTLPDATAGEEYSTQVSIQVPEGASPQGYVVAQGSSLPPGLELSPAGLLSGVPTEPGVFTFSLTLEHSAGSSTVRYQLSVLEDDLRILTLALPGATLDQPYGATLEANRPASELVWTVVSGALPSGLVLDPDGTLAGTPTEAGFFPLTVRVTHPDSGEAAEAVLSLAVSAPASSIEAAVSWAPSEPCTPESAGEGFSWEEGAGQLVLEGVVAQRQGASSVLVTAADASFSADLTRYRCRDTGPETRGSMTFRSDEGQIPEVSLQSYGHPDEVWLRVSLVDTQNPCTSGWSAVDCSGGIGRSTIEIPVAIVRDGAGVPVSLTFRSLAEGATWGGSTYDGREFTASGSVPVVP